MTVVETYTGGVAAKSGQWRIVKTSGGFGVLKSTNGSRVAKSTIVKPASSAASGRVRGTATA